MFIVLRVLKTGGLASFMTYDHGKIIAYYRSARPFGQLMLGSLVAGELVPNTVHKYPFLQDVRLFNSVAVRGYRSQLFLQFITDVVYMFLPQGQQSVEVFILMQMVVESRLFERFDDFPALGPCFCAVLFDVMGFCPPFEVIELSGFMQNFLNDHISSERHISGVLTLSTLLPGLVLRYDSTKDTLRDWIAECLREHPQFKKNEIIWLDMLRNGMWG